MDILGTLGQAAGTVGDALERYTEIYGQIQDIRARRTLSDAAVSAASYDLPTRYQNVQATAQSTWSDPVAGMSGTTIVLVGLAFAGLAYFALRD